jgi:hypothetical protein
MKYIASHCHYHQQSKDFKSCCNYLPQQHSQHLKLYQPKTQPTSLYPICLSCARLTLPTPPPAPLPGHQHAQPAPLRTLLSRHASWAPSALPVLIPSLPPPPPPRQRALLMPVMDTRLPRPCTTTSARRPWATRCPARS